MSKGQFINGRWEAGEGKPFVSQNPTNLRNIWEGHTASINQVNKAITAARDTYPMWMSLSFDERYKYLEKYTYILGNNKQKIADVISKETGKPIWEATGEAGAMINKLAISLQAYEERTPNKESLANGVTTATRHKPHGVLAVFGPFNFPGHLPNGHIIPALLAGNTIIFKPSENTPWIAELLLEFWEESELPAGVLNLVQGDKDVGVQIAEHPELDGILFTGSFNVGKTLTKTLQRYPHRIIALEMGGNNPLIVHESSNIKAAVYTTIQSAFVTSGQRCTCARRLILTKSDHNKKFLEELVIATKNIKVGSPFDDPEPFMGPVINNHAASFVETQTKKMIEQGARPLVVPKRLEGHLPFVTPGILDITDVVDSNDTEVFGPLLNVIWVNNFSDAIKEANNTGYGLSAGLLSDNKGNYQEFFTKIRAGIVNWNKPLTGASSNAPFGGLGKSGNHRPSAYYAADYCAYPVASMESETLTMPEKLTPGVVV